MTYNDLVKALIEARKKYKSMVGNSSDFELKEQLSIVRDLIIKITELDRKADAKTIHS